MLQVVALQVFAQQTDSREEQAPPGQKEDEPELLEVITEEIVVIGSRAKPRSVTKSMVPVDVISSQDFTSQGDADLSNLLRTLAPSYNVSTLSPLATPPPSCDRSACAISPPTTPWC